MTVERETAGFVLPFAAGILAAALITRHTSVNNVHCTIPIVIVISGLVCLIHPSHKTWNGSLIKIIISIIALCCGIWTGVSDKLLSISTLPHHSNIRECAETFCRSLKNYIDDIPFREPETSEMIKALITGERSGISRETLTAFRTSGASHILALSGLHLGIIYAIITRVLSIIGNTPQIRLVRSVVIVLFCGFYTLATGAGASIIRAFLFVLLGEISHISGRKRNLRDILLASLFLQLAFCPGYIKDIGFQLSYAAMAGIAFILPQLKTFIPERCPGILRWIWNSAAISLACQIATAPLAYHYFRSLPQYFLLTNLIAIPLTGMIIPAALVTTTLHTMGCCPEFIIAGTEILVRTLAESLKIISQM